MPHVLLIDDEPDFLFEQVRHAFPAFEVSVARDGEDGLAQLREVSPDVVLLDLKLPDRSGLDVFDEIRQVDARVPVIFVTSARTADTAIEAMKRGAFNYIPKPIDLKQLELSVKEAVDVARRMRAPVLLQPTLPDWEEGALFGICPAMLEVYKSIGQVAAKDVTVLIAGESGTGKELVARAIYQHSARSHAPYMALNCAAIPESLLESELFGHEKGAFTGADRRRIGKFEQHSGGTILLDEIGDMPIALQAKVLRLLQEQTFERMGGNETVRTNVRIIAASHRDLRALVAEGKFRLDLYYRLAVFTIAVPALRHRGEDVALLARHYVSHYSRDLGKELRDVDPETLAILSEYSWPGNVRELQNVLKQAVLRASGFTLLPTFLPVLGAEENLPVVKERAPSAETTPDDLQSFILDRLGVPGANKVFADTRQYVERLLFKLTLERTDGNFRAAAEVLGMSRQTMRMRLRALGISVAHSVELDSED